MSWRDRAPCKGETHLFFSELQYELNLARKMCETCPVSYHCLKDAIDHDLEIRVTGAHDDRREYGIWGGTSRSQRAVIVEGTVNG